MEAVEKLQSPIKTETFLHRALNAVERAGNVVPNPAILFVILAALVVVLSAIVATADITVAHPATGETIRAVNLLTVEGLHRILTSMVTNFTSFAPLGTVLVAPLGIAVAEASGLISTILRLLVMSSPKKLLTAVVVFAGVISHTASDIGYVLLIPLSAMIFLAVGRNPLVGLGACFAGVSGGFSANLLLSPLDAMFAGITHEAAHIIDPAYSVNPAANYYFMAASAILVTILGTVVTEKIVSPLMAYFPLIVAFGQKYDKNFGVGSLMALMLPYSITFFIGWTLFLIVWFYFGLPLGPGAELFYQMPARTQ